MMNIRFIIFLGFSLIASIHAMGPESPISPAEKAMRTKYDKKIGRAIERPRSPQGIEFSDSTSQSSKAQSVLRSRRQLFAKINRNVESLIWESDVSQKEKEKFINNLNDKQAALINEMWGRQGAGGIYLTSAEREIYKAFPNFVKNIMKSILGFNPAEGTLEASGSYTGSYTESFTEVPKSNGDEMFYMSIENNGHKE